MRNWAILFLAAALQLSCFPSVKAEEIPELQAKSAAVTSRDGQLLYGLEPDLMLPIASTTKLMTALVVIENCDLDQPVEIQPAWCGAEGSSMYLKPGESYSVRELLTGLLLVSGNDAAVALAEFCGGSQDAFAAMMNAKAKSLGMRNTHYLNPHGLNEAGHYSTARDLAILMCACMENPAFAETIRLRNAEVGGQTLINHNKLLSGYSGCIGGKTGYTKVAGRCLVSCVEREGTRFVCVTLSDPDDWNDHIKLFDWAFSHFEERVFGAEELQYQVPVLGGSEENVLAVPFEPLHLLVPKDQELKVCAELPFFVFAPVLEGDEAGRLTLYLQDQPLAETTLSYGGSVPVK